MLVQLRREVEERRKGLSLRVEGYTMDNLIVVLDSAMVRWRDRCRVGLITMNYPGGNSMLGRQSSRSRLVFPLRSSAMFST